MNMNTNIDTFTKHKHRHKHKHKHDLDMSMNINESLMKVPKNTRPPDWPSPRANKAAQHSYTRNAPTGVRHVDTRSDLIGQEAAWYVTEAAAKTRNDLLLLFARWNLVTHQSITASQTIGNLHQKTAITTHVLAARNRIRAYISILKRWRNAGSGAGGVFGVGEVRRCSFARSKDRLRPRFDAVKLHLDAHSGCEAGLREQGFREELSAVGGGGGKRVRVLVCRV